MRSVSTTAIFVDNSRNESSCRFFPSNSTFPPTSFNWRVMLFRIVDLPEPFGPISVTISPFSMPMQISLINGLADRQVVQMKIIFTHILLPPFPAQHHENDDRRTKDRCDRTDGQLQRCKRHTRDQVAHHTEDGSAEERSRDYDERTRCAEALNGTAMPTNEIGPANAVTHAERILESRISAMRNTLMLTPMLCAYASPS